MRTEDDVYSSGRMPGLERSSPARVYDALLGGKDNFAVDREAAARLAEKAPEVYAAARANRAFLVRTVRFCAEAGVRQFVDLGSGLPTSPNVHEVALQVHADARVVYVDHDPVVAAHGRALNATDKTAVVHADLREPHAILDHPQVRGLIDFTRPVAVLAVAVLHFLDDRDSVAVVWRFQQVMAAGSYLVITHGSPGTRTDINQATETYAKTTAPIWIRTPEQIAVYFTGCELVEPGLVPAQDWRPGLTSVQRPGESMAVLSVWANLTIWCIDGVFRWRDGHRFEDWATHPAADAAGAAVKIWARYEELRDRPDLFQPTS